MAADNKAARRYHTIVERSLSLFDPSSEWADYIAFLGRLAKAISSGRPEGVTNIPLTASVAKCLSQCLQPSLPSGVHQKALELYDLIFSIIGVEGLSRDLSLFLPGLSHTLAFANLSTRPLILSLYEDYILKLSTRTLRPAAKAVVLSLLPALEEETSEDFERTMAVFENLKGRFAEEGHEAFFWQTLFVASVSSSNRRPGVLVYLTRHLPKLLRPVVQNGIGDMRLAEPEMTAEATVVVTPEPGLLVRCFATGLQDQQPLVQRGFLDLLVTHLPLDAPVFSKSDHTKDVDVLVRAASMVVLRRDMGLNRRLWAWFTGSDGKTNHAAATSPAAEKPLVFEQEYYKTYGLPSLVRSIEEMVNTTSTEPFDKARPFRVALSLMDRWDIGGPVVMAVFLPLLRSLQAYQASAPSQAAFDEVFRSANVFFDAVDIGLVFKQLAYLLEYHEFSLISFVLENFNFEDSEFLPANLQSFCLAVAKSVLDFPGKSTELTQILHDVLALLPPRNKLQIAQSSEGISTQDPLLKSIAAAYLQALNERGETSNLVILGTCLERSMLLEDDLEPLNQLNFTGKLLEHLEQCMRSESQDFSVIVTTAKLVLSLRIRDAEQAILSVDLWSKLLYLLIPNLWSLLTPASPQYHVAASEEIWKLHEMSREFELVESTILSLIIAEEQHPKTLNPDALDCFGTFWTHSRSIKKFADDAVPDLLIRPLLYVIDTLILTNADDPGRRWLLGLPNIGLVIKLIIDANDYTRQSAAITLTRLGTIVRLMKTSPSHWNNFLSSNELERVREQCLSLLPVDNTPNDPALILRALGLIREIHNAENGSPIPDDVADQLVNQLKSPGENDEISATVLETLLSVLSETRPVSATLLPILLAGISSSASGNILDKQITLLCSSLPPYSTLLRNLLKITETFCKRIERAFEELQKLYVSQQNSERPIYPERSIINLLSGMEYVLARAHQQIAAKLDGDTGSVNGSGADSSAAYRAFANDHLTVVLCMQDAVKICAQLWFWRAPGRSNMAARQPGNLADVKSFQYMALKLRSRSRRILENLIEAEPQECLETLIAMRVDKHQAQVLELLQTLDGARPKFMMPATFNAIYSRTNPAALDQSQKSSLSVELRPLDLITFLNDYTAALEDDLLEEIWTDCTTFLREVLANPMPHRQLLITLLEFATVLCRKMENTNFGEALRMRRELADLCARLFTAIFTIKPGGFDGNTSNVETDITSKRNRASSSQRQASNTLQVLCSTLPDLTPILTQADRLGGVCNGIATHITGPSIHARLFPQNISADFLDLLKWMSTTPTATKHWRKDMLDAFNNSRFFQGSPTLIAHWLPLIRQLSLTDKNMMPELLNRLAAPAAAGLMFGVGATAARSEADRRTQLDLRRICVLLLSTEVDTNVAHVRSLLLKLEDLITATPESSPSSATRGDVYLVLRSLLLSFSQEQLSPLWPLLDSELRDFCEDMLKSVSKLNQFSKMQGAKLLDLLLLLRPDEFQLHEWLFVTDTIDAIYPPNNVQSIAYADLIAPFLHSTSNGHDAPMAAQTYLRKPWLCNNESRDPSNFEGLLTSFFSNLSIRAFEDIYTLQSIDKEACRQDLLADLFTDTGST